jgi:hypothetical protein
MLLEDLGLDSLDYEKYIIKNPFNLLLGDDKVDNPTKKIVEEPFLSVDPKNKNPFNAEYDDLIRLHYLIQSRKVTTVLEFGVGKSTVVIADALNKNKSKYSSYIKKTLRRSNPFQCHSIDNYPSWIDECKKIIPKKFFDEGITTLHNASLKMGTFADKMCTYYDPIPDLAPDFIYLDGPDQFSPEGNIRGMSTRSPDRMPMAADILSFEHFLTPGTLIVVDGRTANARFLKSNLQRKWDYLHAQDIDQHFFELLEEPLGIYNKRQIDFCLGGSYYNRLKSISQEKK